MVEVNRMIKQFKESRKMMQQMSKGNMENIPGMEQMLGGGVKGKIGKMAMNRSMKKTKKRKKKKRKRNKESSSGFCLF
ncbi:signal recognition particle subunit [Tetragenococcus muriaticus PMC-11-5]|uniref:Signal recognition particle subunit n=1 Tax=Tetragenococcus muriaticus PMC-11-5 TaxID=1302649 RepID=A0A091C6T5_9ENTE|nr:signal recognition particle subunit [Tetragenococcus muriaticus PMC-11-5]